MFKVIARFAPAVAAFGALTSGSFAVSARRVERAAEMPSVTVRYADLNLNTPAGVEALYARLRAASRSVCYVGQRRALVDVMAALSVMTVPSASTSVGTCASGFMPSSRRRASADLSRSPTCSKSYSKPYHAN